MAESFPSEQQVAVPAGTDPEFQRVLGRLKQEQVQLAVDQRQLKQQRVSLEQLKAELDARHREVDAAVQSFQSERLALDDQKHAGQRALDAQHSDLHAQQQALAKRAAELDQAERNLKAQAERLDYRRQGLDACQADLQARQRTLDDRQLSLDRHEADLQTSAASLTEQQLQRQQETHDLGGAHEQLKRQQDALRDEQSRLKQRDADLQRQTLQFQADQHRLHEQTRALDAQQLSLSRQQADLQTRSDDLDKQRRDLLAHQESLRHQQEQAAQLQQSLAAKQRQLADLEADLHRTQQSLKQEQAAPDAQLTAAREQVVSLNRRLEGLQAELVRERKQKHKAVADRDDLAHQCNALQTRLDEWMEAQKATPAGLVSHQPMPPAPADELALLAAHAVQARRRGAAPRRFAPARQDRTRTLAAAAGALLVGLFVGLVLLRAQPARYRMQASLAFLPESPLAAHAELTRLQYDLGGRLLAAGVPGASLPADRPPVVADPKSARLTVQLLTVAPEQSQASLRKFLAEYRVELEGTIHDAARAQQDRERIDQADASDVQRKQLAAQRTALAADAAQYQPHVKAYQEALATADKTRNELEEANRKAADVAARLRVFKRTPPGTRIELPAERLAAVSSADVQLAEVRGQVIARATELRTLLAGLLGSALKKCDQMDNQVGAFATFLAGEQERITDQALREETSRIAQQAARLKDLVQRSRKQIDDLAGALAKSEDVALAASLVTVHAQSEKALESLTTEAEAQIKQIDDLLEKIPAGGVDVTRRTVLQQRLRARFAEVQKTQHDLNETLNSLRPAVNFRLDAALTAVSGLSRRLMDRQKALVEQVQQQDAQSRRQDYDRQVQQAETEREELGIQRDRLMTLLTEAARKMLEADPGRAKLIQLRAQLEDLDRRIAATSSALDAAKRKQVSLTQAALQPAVLAAQDPEILKPAINRGARLVSSAATGLIVSLVLFGAYVLASQYLARRSPPTPAPPSLPTSRN